MPRQVKWPDNRPREYVSPFQRGAKERNLRLTLHSEALQGGGANERRALDDLLALATLPGIEIAQTKPGILPHLRLDPESEGWDAHEAAVWAGTNTVRHGSYRVDAKSQFPTWVAGVEAFDRPECVYLQTVRDELLLGVAHMAVRHDIFVTTSPRLLALRNNWDFLRRYQHMVGINPRLPSEAVKIVSLFQRSRDEYRTREFYADEVPRITVYRSQFYLTVAYGRLPQAWRFESACGRARRPDDTYDLAKSVLLRFVRALEARDALGILYYTPNADSIADRVVYHFDYLNLILSGAFDALGRVAHRVYGITSPNEFNAGLHRDDFRKALNRSGASDLDQLVSETRLQDLLFIIGRLRNTIHGTAVEARNVGGIENLNMGFIEVPDTQAPKIWARLLKLGSPEDWGAQQRTPTSSQIQNPYSLHIEPYTYAIKLETV